MTRWFPSQKVTFCKTIYELHNENYQNKIQFLINVNWNKNDAFRKFIQKEQNELKYYNSNDDIRRAFYNQANERLDKL